LVGICFLFEKGEVFRRKNDALRLERAVQEEGGGCKKEGEKMRLHKQLWSVMFF